MGDSRLTRPRLDERGVACQGKALAVVQRLLRERGVRAWCHQTISLGLSAVRGGEATSVDVPVTEFWLERFPPELVVTGPQGWREATVTVEERSGAYLLFLRDSPGPHKVEQEEPGKVVDLIAGALGAAR